jgi:hypothetical protein
MEVDRGDIVEDGPAFRTGLQVVIDLTAGLSVEPIIDVGLEEVLDLVVGHESAFS